MANWWDKNLTDKQKFLLQEPKDPSLLDVVSTVPNPVGDVASGLLAAQDFSKANYGSAALNSLGLLPFVPSLGAVLKNSDTFEQLAKTGKIRQAKNKEQELNDLISGKSKFAEVRLNWDDPKTYDLADKLKAQGFDSTVTQQGKDMVTLFHKSAEDVSPVLNAKTPYDFGKAYGYTDNDIAAFYNNRYGKDAEKYWKQDSKFLPAKTEFEKAQNLAQQRATLPVSEGGLGLPATNTSMDRAKALGYTQESYKGMYPYDVTSAPSFGYKDGTWQQLDKFGEELQPITAINPDLMSRLELSGKHSGFYGDKDVANRFAGYNRSGAVFPVLLNMGDNPVIKNASGNYAGSYQFEKMANKANTMDDWRDFQKAFYADSDKTGAIIKNTTDEGTIFIPKNPNQIRSINAAFDPFRRNEADILAGVGVGVPVASGLLDIENKKVPKKEKKKTK